VTKKKRFYNIDTLMDAMAESQLQLAQFLARVKPSQYQDGNVDAEDNIILGSVSVNFFFVTK
jgi:hypothetical protein